MRKFALKFYDGASTVGAIGTAGDLTRSSAFFDLPASVTGGTTVHSQDTTYGYDAGANGIGQRTSMSVPGGASTNWSYDARERKISATDSVPGWSARARSPGPTTAPSASPK